MSNQLPVEPTQSINPNFQKPKSQPRWVKAVHNYFKDMGNGVINVIIHDGRVTQVERTERVRFEREIQDYEI